MKSACETNRAKLSNMVHTFYLTSTGWESRRVVTCDTRSHRNMINTTPTG